MIKKIYKIFIINSKFILIDFFISISFFFYKCRIYIIGFDNFYLRLLFRYFNKNNLQESLSLAGFLFKKLNTRINNVDFISVIFDHSGYKNIGVEINNFSEMSRIISRKINNTNDIILITPDSFSRIGHLCCLDYFIKAIKLNLIDAKKIIISGPIKKYNPGVLKLFENFLEIEINDRFYESKYFKDFFLFNIPSLNSIRIKDGRCFNLPQFIYYIDELWNQKHKEPLLSVDKEGLLNTQKILRLEGLDILKDRFVILHVRENAYEKIFNLRNAKIHTYSEAIEFLVNKGLWVIRIGDKNMNDFNFPSKKFIDLRKYEKQQEIITYLAAQSFFQIATGSGPQMLNIIFKKPILSTNMSPLLSSVGCENDLILPKMYFREENKKVVNIEERFHDNFASESSNYYHKQNIYIENNSKELLRASVEEMYNKINLNENYELSANQIKFKEFSKNNNIAPQIISKQIEKIFPDFFNTVNEK
jgi:putative glycosyltransferase (TIGR04372 family)